MARRHLYEGPKGERLWTIYSLNGSFDVVPPSKEIPRRATLEGYAATEEDAKRIASNRQEDSRLSVDRFMPRRLP